MLLDSKDFVFTIPPDLDRKGAVSAIAPGPSGTVHLLCSGHVALPAQGDKICRALLGAPRTEIEVGITRATAVKLELKRGGLSPAGDWTLASAAQAPASIDFTHPARGETPPHLIRLSPLLTGEPVFIWSPMRGFVCGGIVEPDDTDTPRLDFDDGTSILFSGSVRVVSVGKVKFSQSGDSGALVVDEKRQVVGTILGGPIDYTRSFVQPISWLLRALGADASWFFEIGG